MRITADEWQSLIQTCSDTAQLEGYRPTPSKKPALLRRTAEAVFVLNEIASESPERYCDVAQLAGVWPVMWVDEVSARVGFFSLIEKLEKVSPRKTSPEDFTHFERVRDAVNALTEAANEDIPRFAKYLEPCGWPVLIPLGSKRQRMKKYPEQPKIVALLSDQFLPLFRIYQPGTKNTSKRPLRIDLESPLNQATGTLYGITLILWRSKQILAFDDPNPSKLALRINTAINLWQKRTRVESIEKCSAAEVMKFLNADTSEPSANEAFATMLKIINREAGGPGMIRELRPSAFKNQIAPSAKMKKHEKFKRFDRAFRDEITDANHSGPAQQSKITEDNIRRGAKTALKDAMNWLRKCNKDS